MVNDISNWLTNSYDVMSFDKKILEAHCFSLTVNYEQKKGQGINLDPYIIFFRD